MLVIVVGFMLAAVSYFVLSRRTQDYMSPFSIALVIAFITIASVIPVNGQYTQYHERGCKNAKGCYTIECPHNIDKGNSPYVSTQAFTTLLQSCLTDDDTTIQYCPLCYTRDEALTIYFKSR